jgi:ABC-type amino acid transport substrate-binding protein
MRFPALFCMVLAWLAAAPAAAQTGTLDKIRKSGVVTMGYLANSAPFSSVGADGQPQGYSIELCREVANSIRGQLGLAKLETRWVELTIQNRLEAVSSRRVDLECSTTTWTLARQKDVDFSLITFVDGGSVLTQAGSGTGRLADFNGKRIAVISGTTTEKALRDAVGQRGVKAEIVIVKTRDDGLQLLEQRKVDGFASDRVVLIGLALGSQAKGAYKLLDEDFSIEPYALALPKGDHDFRLAVNRGLARLYRGGGIEKVYKQWLGRYGSPSLLLSAAYFIQGVPE